MPAVAPFPRPVDAPFLGVGVGLRPVHYPAILERGEAGDLGVDWFEALSENYMVRGGRPLRMLDTIRGLAPMVLHGVSMNIGSSDPLDPVYLDALAELARRSEPGWISDHLCWTGVERTNLHDLMPMPYTEASLAWVASRVLEVQDRLGRRIALENPSSYLTYASDEMSECEYLVALAERADCGILLDLNNVYVSANNHDFDARAYVDAIPAERVFQIHLAGPSDAGPLLIDTHDSPVRPQVWDLYAYALERLGPVSTLIEWDDQIPPYEELLEEVQRARAILERVTHTERRPAGEPCGKASASSPVGR